MFACVRVLSLDRGVAEAFSMFLPTYWQQSLRQTVEDAGSVFLLLPGAARVSQ